MSDNLSSINFVAQTSPAEQAASASVHSSQCKSQNAEVHHRPEDRPDHSGGQVQPVLRAFGPWRNS